MRGVAAWSILLLLSPPLASCQTAPSFPPPVWNTVTPSLRIPVNVERLAILYPKTYNRELMDAYTRLAGATFQLKEQRPSLHIVERFDLPTIRSEQSFQLSGAVSDSTAVGLGRLLGADSILLYQIEGPTIRDRILAKMYGGLPPFTVTSKVIRVESAEVVYYNVVTAPVASGNDSSPSFVTDSRYDLPFQAALNRGITQTIGDLQHAFGN
jgi:hypothetical protein